MSSGKDIETDLGLFDKVTKFVTSKKGMYILGTVLLLCVVYYFTMCKKSNKTNNNDKIDDQEIPQPPPGFVTVPIDMIQELQNKAPTQIPLPQPQEIVQQQVQPIQQQLYQQQQQAQQQAQVQPQLQPSQNNDYNLEAPNLKHNQKIEDDEEPEIAEQNLSKEEMETIQAQLNAMQQQRSSN